MSRLQVLIVDDNDVDRYIQRRMIDLTGASVDVMESASAQQAIDQMQNGGCCPDVIFVDINMPVMDGWSFLQAYQSLQAQCQRLDATVIMFSSSALDQEQDRALAHECVSGYLVKGQFDATTLQQFLS